MKTLQELEQAMVRWENPPLKELDGFSYIPWEESVYHANEIFGPFGWSSSVLSCDYVETTVLMKQEDGALKPREFKGFKSIVRITVKFLVDVAGMHEVQESHHDGVGFGAIISQGNKNPMDTACKAAKSDGISTAMKHFGDAFGLFLYREKTRSTPGSPTPTNGAKPTNGNGTVSQNQAGYLVKLFGFAPEEAAKMPLATGKGLLDAVWSKDPATKLTPAEALVKFGFPVPATNGKKDLF